MVSIARKLVRKDKGSYFQGRVVLDIKSWFASTTASGSELFSNEWVIFSA
jgi:hypothetical protein